MNDPSVDNPRLLTAAGEEEHIARERARRCRRCGAASPCPGGQTVAGAVCELVTQQPPAGAGAANVPDENSNAAVAVGASMARAVLAAEHYRQVGAMPAWAIDSERTAAP